MAGYGSRVEHWIVTAGSARLETVVTVRGADVRFDTAIDGANYAEGRSGGLRWRRTPNELVRVIASDVQGDDLDRWPLAFFPYAASDCAVIGETSTAPAAWVVEYRAAHDSPHWFFVDESTGHVVREIFREGSRNVTFAFSDFRSGEGGVRPNAWHVSGAGGDADVTIAGIVPQAVAADVVAIPPSHTALAQFSGPSAVVPAIFNRDRITIDSVVNGHPGRFFLDTGTTQILIDEGAARNFGLKPILGHAIVHRLSTGSITFDDLAAETVSLEGFGVDGILGNDYFVGHIMHVDYRHSHADVLPEEGFVPPPGTMEVVANFDEGMPLVPAVIGDVETSRVALDTGSADVLVLRPLSGFNPSTFDRLGIGHGGVVGRLRFLEGAIGFEYAPASKIEFAGFLFLHNQIRIEAPWSGDAVDFPIDAIFGTQVLDQFEWWYDYDRGQIWIRPAQ